MKHQDSDVEHESAGTSGDGHWWRAVATSPLLWGGLVAAGFYSVIPYLPVYRELATKYFCSHPLEYATAALFFVGMATLGLKALRLRCERGAFERDPLDDPALTGTADQHERASRLDERLKRVSATSRRTHLIRRIQDANVYVRGRRSVEGLEKHLKYLAELAANQLHESYALVRTITWAVPILGFLGTVIGITMAIVNVTPEQLDTSLREVTGGLAVAFDTTALALTLSLVLVFSSFVVERAEGRILERVEEYGMRRIGCLFPAAATADSPLVMAEAQAAEKLLERTETLIDWQMKVWQESVESLRQRWTDTLQTQQSALNDTLQQGLSATLTDHTDQLEEMRRLLLGGFQDASSQLKAQAEQSAQAMSETVSGWQEDLRRSSETASEQLEALNQQSELLLQIVGQEEQLTRLQGQLTDNLQAVRAAETFEETLHSLNAAVHLLTARTKPKAA